jgi:6-hydroxytryprostatin B O-methyltransferase
MGYVLQYHDITALAVVIEFNLAQHVPLDSEISFKELSLVSGAPLGRLERILRLLFVRRIFHEPRPGYIAHTTASERLVTNPELTAFLGHCTHEAFPAASTRIPKSPARLDSMSPLARRIRCLRF